MSFNQLPPNYKDNNFDDNQNNGDRGLKKLANRFAKNLEKDELIQITIDYLRNNLEVDRVVIYYFYRKWKGQVIYQSVKSSELSIFGSTGEDGCFNDEYAAMYLTGRIRTIADIEIEPMSLCHKEFLQSLQVRANLVIPILNSQGLWGLLIAHHCESPRTWLEKDIELMQLAAKNLESVAAIQDI